MAALPNHLAAGGAVAWVTGAEAGVGAAWGAWLRAAFLACVTLQNGPERDREVESRTLKHNSCHHF